MIQYKVGSIWLFKITLWSQLYFWDITLSFPTSIKFYSMQWNIYPLAKLILLYSNSINLQLNLSPFLAIIPMWGWLWHSTFRLLKGEIRNISSPKSKHDPYTHHHTQYSVLWECRDMKKSWILSLLLLSYMNLNYLTSLNLPLICVRVRVHVCV